MSSFQHLRASARAAWFSLALPASVGCVSGLGRPAERVPLELGVFEETPGSRELPPPTSLPLTVVTGQEALGVDELLSRATDKLALGNARGAAADFDRVVSHDASGPWSARALLGGGQAWEALEELEAAAQRFEQLARRFPASPLANQARLRSVRLRVYQGRFRLAGHSAAALLANESDLRPVLRALADAALALAELEAGQRAPARERLTLSQSRLERLGVGRLGRIPTDLAAFYFAVGELHRSEAEQLAVLHRPEGFAARLEARCQALLRAQAGYEAAMRAYDAHWSALAGYRLGQLYERLHQELLRVPAPEQATPEQVPLFRAAMSVRYAVLVRKASAMMSHTLALARRASVDSPWRLEAERALKRLSATQRALEQQIAELPYTADELEIALRSLAGPT